MSNLLDKASIILTPTAYNNGEALCVKPSDGSGDFDFSRNSAATRVNAQGLVENVQILSSNLVQNGDFSEEGSEEVSNGSFTNGSTDWTLGTGWSIGEDKAVYSDGAKFSQLKQTLTNNNTSYYKVTFDAVINSGQFRVKFGSNNYDIITTTDTYTIYGIFSASNTNITFEDYDDIFSDFSITNISVKEVGQNWTLGTGWSIGDNKAVAGSLSNGADIRQVGIFQQSKKYKISIDADKISGTNIILRTYNGSFQTIGDLTENSSFIYTTTATNNGTLYIVSNNFIGSITNISIIEITDDTNLPRINYEGFSYQDALGSELITGGNFSNPSDWSLIQSSISNDKLTISTLDGSYSSARQFNALVIGKTYLFTIDVESVSNGSIAVGNSNLNITSSGIHTGYYVSNSTAAEIKRNTFGSATDVIVNSLSVKEYLGQEVVPDSGCGSWLWEPQSTNLIPYSEDFSQWTTAGTITLESGYLSPDGTNNATKVTSSDLSGFLYNLTSMATNTTRSIYARTVSGSGTISLLSKNDNTNNTFTLTEQWQRLDLNETLIANSIFYAVDFRSGATLSEVILWGANATNDQDYPTSYIPTSGSSVTRNQDLCTNGGSLASINSTEGTLYFEGAVLDVDSSAGYITISNGVVNNNAIRLLYHNSNAVYFQKYVNGVRTTNLATTSITKTDFNKIAIRYNSTDVSVFVNGVNILNNADTNIISPNTLNVLGFATGENYNPFYGKTKALAVWKEALSDSELQSLTTI